jgi:hypothetical protein
VASEEKDWALESLHLQQHLHFATLRLLLHAPSVTTSSARLRYRLPRAVRALLIDRLTSREGTDVLKAMGWSLRTTLLLDYSEFSVRDAVSQPVQLLFSRAAASQLAAAMQRSMEERQRGCSRSLPAGCLLASCTGASNCCPSRTEARPAADGGRGGAAGRLLLGHGRPVAQPAAQSGGAQGRAARAAGGRGGAGAQPARAVEVGGHLPPHAHCARH